MFTNLRGFRTALFFGLILSAVSACSFHELKGATPGNGANAQSLGSFDALKAEIFQPKCVRCHSAANASGGVDLSTYQAILSNPGLVTVRDPNNSRVYTEIESGDMPVGGPALTAVEVQAVSDWILAGAPEGSFPSQDPSTSPKDPTPTATPIPEPVAATFFEVENKILTQRCIQCHSGSKPAGHVDLTSFQAIASSSKKLALSGDPSHSLLYTEIESGSMPPKGPKLSADLIQLMKDWINDGAKND